MLNKSQNNLKNILQTDNFVLSKLHSMKLIELLNKISKKKNSYPYMKIKKFICKELNLSTTKKTLDNLNILDNYDLLFLYYKFNVLIFETKVNEFVYYSKPEITKTIFIFQKGFNYYQVEQNIQTIQNNLIISEVMDNKISEMVKLPKTYWKSNNLPEELHILINQNDYIKSVIKNYIKINSKQFICQKENLSAIVNGIENYLDKKLSNSEKIHLYKNIHVILEFNCN